MSREALLVDDHADIRFLMERVLAGHGFVSREAEHGRAALERLAEAVPDLVVLDVQMPEMTGWDTLGAIRADPRTVDVPVLMCTVKSGPEDLVRAFELGADGFLNKPFNPPGLVAAVDEVMSGTPEERRARRAAWLHAARS